MKRILIVDDSPVIHSLIKQIMGGESIELFSFFNGQEVLDFIAANNPFDLILLDWEMPVLNGPETIRAIRSKEPEAKVVMLTSKTEMSHVEQMLSLGVLEYIFKPFTSSILKEKCFPVIGLENADESTNS